MLGITDTKGTSVTVNAQDVTITETIGSLNTVSFNYMTSVNDYKTGEILGPFTTIHIPEVNENYILQTYNSDIVGDYLQYSVTAIQEAKVLHYKYMKDKFGFKTVTKKGSDGKTTTEQVPIKLKLVDVLRWLFKDTKFTYKLGKGLYYINQQFFKDGLGPGYADELLTTACQTYGVEFYWTGTVCNIEIKLGDKDKFVFVDNINCDKIAAQEDDSVITTYAEGTTTTKTKVVKTVTEGKKQVKKTETVTKTITSKYTSPLVEKNKWPIISAQPFQNETTTDDSSSDDTGSDSSDNPTVMTQKELDDKVKSLVHDYPNIQYTVDGVNFKRYADYGGKIKLGDTGYLRTRQGIDVETRVSSITWYPQDDTKDDTVTFGNLALDPTSYLVHQRRQLERYENYYNDMSSAISSINDFNDGLSDDIANLVDDFDQFKTKNTEDVDKIKDLIDQLNKSKEDTEKDNQTEKP